MNRFFTFFGLMLLLQITGYAQQVFPVNGVNDERPGIYAFQNATVITQPGQMIENATLLIRDGKIEALGQQVTIPTEAIVVDLEGKYIYPSFIDPHSHYGLPDVQKPSRRRGPQANTSLEGAYNWNEAIKSFYEAAGDFKPEAESAKAYRSAGFGTVLAFRPDGIARGTSVVVNLSDDAPHKLFLKEKAGAHYSFKKGSSSQDYPTSQMGAIALLRQTYLDAQWYNKQDHKAFHDIALESFNESQNIPQFFEVADKLEVLRADKIGDEFGVQYIIKGAGDEYQRADEIKATGASLIIPVVYPEAYEVSDPYDALNVSLAEMKHWELAPANAAILADKGITFAFTVDGLDKKEDFLKHVRKAVENGLSEEQALEALTTNPAKMLKVEDITGTLETGKQANFLIASGAIFEDETVVYQNWVEGKRYELQPLDLADYRGMYDLTVKNKTYRLKITGEPAKQKAVLVKNDTTELEVKSIFEDEHVTFSFNPDDRGDIRLSGWAEENRLRGQGQMADGEWINWTATYTGEVEDKEEKKEEQQNEEAKEAEGKVIYPFLAFGHEEVSKPQTMLVRNATVWTNEEGGILENTDVFVEDGKIARIGRNLNLSADIEIDGTDKHLTSGIIDEHSHIAISKGVNEAGQAVTAEVRIGDVINSDDINIYRQLAGGVTAAQLLHGSANPIGGQSGLIKLRWGKSPEEMKIDGADGFIKFALGENVKQSNWGDAYNERFPQTRMGVEQVLMDAFERARAYEEAHKAYSSLSKRKKKNEAAPRKDLEMEALVEIMNSERFVTSHSYVQSEINMLMKTAEENGFRINTFTHILEGYKVADKMKAHGVGASTFADWWAYKFEVRDAIPYNAVILNNMGVVTAINSDDAEMGRRLNQEAAKMVKYGDMSEEDAWKLVTLNPAKLLHLDDHMGSIRVGKDADLVLWSDHPLSVYAQAEKTMIDGVIYFDQQRDKELREFIRSERARLIQKMREAKTNGNGTQPAAPNHQHLWHCSDY